VLSLTRRHVAALFSVGVWVCAGDQQYEACWPAVLKDADGVILMHDPDQPGHEVRACVWPAALMPMACAVSHTAPLQKEVALFYEWFVTRPGMRPERCLSIALSKQAAASTRPSELPVHSLRPDSPLSRTHCACRHRDTRCTL
jgi:Rab-like protein 5